MLRKANCLPAPAPDTRVISTLSSNSWQKKQTSVFPKMSTYSFNLLYISNSLICFHDFHYKGVKLMNQISDPVFISPAHANDGLQHAAGAEAEHVSVGAEGSHRAGAGPGGAEPALSLHAGYLPAAILTCHSSLRLHPSTTGAQTIPAGPQLITRGTVVPNSPRPGPLLTGCCRGGEEG